MGFDHRPAHPPVGQSAASAQTGLKFDPGRVDAHRAVAVKKAMRRRQHKVRCDQRPGAKPLADDVQPPDSVPSAGVIAGL